MNSSSNKINDILEDLKLGKCIILVDDETRENEGDVVFLAENITEENISFMMNECRGLICLTIDEEKRSKLEIDYQVTNNQARFGTNFSNSISHISCTNGGISAKDRAYTIREASNKHSDSKTICKSWFYIPRSSERRWSLN